VSASYLNIPSTVKFFALFKTVERTVIFDFEFQN